MSIYTDYMDIESCNEGVFFISSSGKELKKEIKEGIKKFNNTEGMMNKIKKSFSQSYDRSMADKSRKFVKDKLKDSFSSGIVTVTYSDGNGGTYTNYEEYITGLYKGNLYRITLSYSANYSSLTSFYELDMSKCIIPIDIISLSLKSSTSGMDIRVNKNSISFEKLDSGSGYQNINSIIEKIIKETESKHSDLECSKGKLSSKVKFKKKK